MIRFSLLFIMIIMAGCTSSRVVKRTSDTIIRDVVIETDSTEFKTRIDIKNVNPIPGGPYKWEVYEADTATMDVKIPVKVKFKSHIQKLKIDKQTTVDVFVQGTIDSGVITPIFKINKLAYQESTVIKTKETKVTKTSFWDFKKILILIGIIALIIAVLKFIRK